MIKSNESYNENKSLGDTLMNQYKNDIYTFYNNRDLLVNYTKYNTDNFNLLMELEWDILDKYAEKRWDIHRIDKTKE